MAQKKKNLKQQKQKQKQKQQQTVIVNVLTSKKRRSTKKGKPSYSGGSSITSTPIIQTLPIQYTPYTMYDTSRLLTEANMRSLIPTEVPRPLTVAPEPIGIQLADPTKATDTFTQEQLGEFLEDPNKQAPKVNDIMDNVGRKQGADATEKNNRRTGASKNCPCGGKYKDTEYDYYRHINTEKHEKYEKRIGILTSKEG